MFSNYNNPPSSPSASTPPSNSRPSSRHNNKLPQTLHTALINSTTVATTITASTTSPHTSRPSTPTRGSNSSQPSTPTSKTPSRTTTSGSIASETSSPETPTSSSSSRKTAIWGKKLKSKSSDIKSRIIGTNRMSSIPYAGGGSGGAVTTVLARTPIKVTAPLIVSTLGKIWTQVLHAEGGERGTVLVERWLWFLKEVQKEEDGAEVVIRARDRMNENLNTRIAFAELVEYLTRPGSTAVRIPDPKNRDASHPLTSYFISSSHNTYLVGHQLYGDSTTRGYINVLRRGSRCIEIDVWDGDDGEPQVFHGYTLTKEISFKDVCKAIRDHAFWREEGEGGEVVDGPVIISLECHASHEQQIRMVEIMKKVWQGMLVDKPLYGEESCHEVKKVPTLADLRGKILVKTKYVPRDPVADAAYEAWKAATTTGPPPQRVDVSDSDTDTENELAELAKASNKPKPPRAKISRELADLAIYCGASHFPGNFSHPNSLRPTHVFSFSEKVFKSHSATMEKEIIVHNKTHFMRVYPFGLRFSSSNADPTSFWRRGVQLVALNWQKFDEGMMLNEGMFAGEGGYVLKPPQLRPEYTGGEPKERKLDLEIEVLAAQGVPLPDDDDKPKDFEPYVKVEVYLGDPKIEAGEEVKARTKKALNKGIDVAWDPLPKKKKSRNPFKSSKRNAADDDDEDEESSTHHLAHHLAQNLHLKPKREGKLPKIGETLKFKNVPGLVEGAEMLGFVRFKIHDEEFGRDDLAAWACVRLDRLRQGYRFVRLLDREGRRVGGKVGSKGVGSRWQETEEGEQGVLLVRVRWSVV